jgi:hypothetical protein
MILPQRKKIRIIAKRSMTGSSATNKTVSRAGRLVILSIYMISPMTKSSKSATRKLD